MKKMRVLSFLLVLCMLLSMLPTGAFALEREETIGQKTANQKAVKTGVDEAPVTLTSPNGDMGQILAENQPDRVQSVTVEKIEKPDDVEALPQSGQSLKPQQSLYDTQELVRAIVILEDKGLLEQGYSTDAISAQTIQVVSSQKSLLKQQEAVTAAMGRVVQEVSPEAELEVRYHYTIAANGMAVELPYGALARILSLDGVKAAFLAPQYEVPRDMTDNDAVLPCTHATSPAIGAVKTWDVGYTGQGMRIAIVDTGLDLDHPSFAAAPQEPSLNKEELSRLIPNLNAAGMFQGLNADRLYRSEKVPYAFNYVDGTLDVTHDNDDQGDHGTHVAGIAAANRLETTDVVGVAPDAQLLIMKVFGANGGAYFDDILACLEDCYVLNVDVVNMSLGTPAGFTSLSPEIDEIFARILQSDMVAAIAAGNSYSAAYMNGTGTNRNQTSDPDNGIMSSPASYIGATSVASVENSAIRFNYVELENGAKIPYNDVAATALTTLYWVDPAHRAEFVMIPGTGSAEDFAGYAPAMDEEGVRLYGVSIAVIQRGGIDFVTKQANAAAVGFDACIVYDNTEGDLLNMVDGGVIPNVYISKASGEAMLEAAGADRRGVLYLKSADETETVPSSLAGQMSDFSSWGVTPDLQLNPEVTAPGGNIYSTLTNGHYGMMSGTSMASPNVAGMSALILEYLHETYPELTDAELHTAAESLLMSTAEPVMEFEGVPYSPRKQGAGSANVYRAITSPAYLTVNNGAEKTPKVSFGDDHARTGVYYFCFDVNNLTDQPLVYALEGQAMTDQFMEMDGLKFMSETSRGLEASVTFSVAKHEISQRYDYNGDGVVTMADVQDFLDAVNGLAQVTEGFDLTDDGTVDTADVQKLYELVQETFVTLEKIEVPANGRATVYATVTLTHADKAYMDENYPNGIYVDGFIRLRAPSEDAVDLSLPFLGFYGDWSQAPAIDDAWYYDVNAIAERYVNVLFTDYGTTSFNLGLNPYILEDYDPEHNVLSPNGDGYSDKISEIYLGMMRNAKRINFTWLDEDGNELFNGPYDYAMKNYYFAAYDFVPPLIYTEVCSAYDFRNRDGSYAVQNMDRVQLQISAMLDDGDDIADQVITTDIVIDTQAPVLDMSSMVYDYDEATDTRTLTFTVSDNYDIAAVVPLTKGAAAFDYIPVTTKEAGVDGESAAITLDVSDYDSVFQIAVCDYGTNESYYQISFGGQQNYRKDSFFAYRLFSAIPQDSNIYLTEAYNGWQSFLSADQMLMHTSMLDEGETYTYAAEYVDGYIVGIDANSIIYATELGQWVRTDLGKLEAEMMIEFYPGGYEVGDYYMMNVQFPALDMAFDHTTDTLYVLTDESMYLGPNTGGHLLTVDWLTGEATYVGRVSGLTDDHQALTLACDNDGVLYTVDAITGDLYTINRETAVATFVGQTGYTPLYQQSMTVDHETNKLYWAAYQDVTGVSSFFEVDKTTGQLLSATATEYNSQLSGLFKPYDTHRNLVPDGAALTGLTLMERKLTLRGGDTTNLHCQPQPYYAELNAEDLTWTTSDSAVATVENGTVAAVGSGTAIITAAVGELTASCQVEVVTLGGQLYAFNFGTDMSTANAWITMDVNQPQSAKLLSDAMAISNGVTAAAYVDGSVYAFDSAGAFYELDAETFQGRLLKPADNTTAVTAMAFNYADGFLYALSYDGNSSFALCQVNLYTGELRPVMESLEMMYGTPLGGMAIDYEGRFYFMNLDASGALRLDSFKLTYDGWMYMGEGYVSATLPGLNCYSFSSLAWSEQNDGLFWANDQGQLHWIGVEVDTRLVEEEWGEYEETYLDASAVLLGGISDAVSPATGQAMIMGLLEIPEREPQCPEVPLQSAAMPESITVAAGGHTQTGLSVEPWNAKYTVEYAMADTTVATVSDSGIITGVSKGNTTLTATIYHADGTVFQTLTAEVKAVFSDVDVYCFMITDGANGGDAWLRMNGADPNKLSVAGNTTAPVYAAAYYDGKVYAVSPTDEEYGYRNHLMRIDSSSFVVEEVLPVALPCDLRDMAFDYTTGTMYGIAQSGTVTGGVAQIDLTTGAVTVVADTGSELVTLSCDADGQLYTITVDGVLCRLDKYTGALEEIQKVSGSLSGYQSMHYDHVTGNTYWGRDALYLVDTKNGNTTMLGRIGGTYMLVGSVFTMPSEELEPDVPETTGVTGICLTERAAVVRGETAQLTASVLPVSVSQVDKTVTWTSSDTAVATVDVNGVVTGISGGTVTITATAGDYTDTCVVTVLEEAQKFYAYEENSHRWVQIDTGTGDLITVREEPTLAPIVSAADTGETIYAYDEDGYFYSIDPASFARTKLSDGVHGMTQDAFDGWTYYTTEVNITDMSYDAESGRLFGILNGLYEDGEGLYLIYSALVEINLQAGRLNPYSYEEMEVGQIIFITTYGDGNMVYRPGNLLVKGGYAYSVDTWYSGILSRVSLTWDPWMEFYYAGDCEQLAHVNQLEWGMFFDSRSLVYDPVFDVTYTFHDLGQDELGSARSDVTLCTINLGNAATSEVCNLGKDVVLNSLIIR